MPRKGHKLSKETKIKIGNANRGKKGRIPSDEERKQRSERMSGENHPNYGRHWNEETRKKMSDAKKGKPSNRKGVKLSEETKQRISESKKGTPAWNAGIKNSSPIAPGVGGDGGWYKQLDGTDVWLRSPNEIRVAKLLDSFNINWKYEPTAFDLGDTYYHPDFLVDNKFWWEIKGRYSTVSKNKIIKFSLLYPNEHIRILYTEDIEMVECTKELTNDIIKNIGTDVEKYKNKEYKNININR
jgi:hypothetical protein